MTVNERTTTATTSAALTKSSSQGLKQRINDGQVGLFATFALVMLAAVIVIGLVLGLTFRSEASRRGLAEGRAEAILIAETAVGPELNGRPLSEGLTANETAAMNRLVATSIKSRHVLLLRLRDLDGAVVFSSDKSDTGKLLGEDDR